MGCVFSQPRQRGEQNPRLFKVLNMDKDGQECNPGKIEITDSELIFHQKHKEPIRWPLRSLRRYGFDAEVFSFESGRRCPTGQGIYAFKSVRAEALFNLLQECIQCAGQTEGDVSVRTPGSVAIDSSQRPMSFADLNPPDGTLRQNSIPPTHVVNHADGFANGMNGVVSLQAFPQISSNRHEYINAETFPLNQPPHHHHHHHNGANGGVPHLFSHGNTSPTFHAAADPMLTPASPSNVTLDLSRQVSLPADPEPQIQYAELDLGGGVVSSGGDAHIRAVPPQTTADSSHANYMNCTTNCGGKVGSANNNGVLAGLATTSHANKPLSGGTSLSSSVPLMEAPLPPVPEDYDLTHEHTSEHTANYLNLRIPQMKPKVTYIEVDFKNNDKDVTGNGQPQQNGSGNAVMNGHMPASGLGDNVPPTIAPPTPSTESYAVIDFNKTAAINALNTHVEDEGVRKTRHNSNIDFT